jgi:NAD(P)-dependent dehydrogenase (short-subunit alcohol dehydrogenase family)
MRLTLVENSVVWTNVKQSLDNCQETAQVVTATTRRAEELTMTDLDLTGRTALVSGAAQGLGEGMAQALAAAGARVVVADLQDDLGEKVADSLKGDGHGFVHLDVTSEASWENATTAAAGDFGGLDILVNNAGVEISSLITDVDPQDIRTMLEVNVLGTALGIKHGLKAMRPDGAAGKGGAIVNISSVAATIAFPGIAGYSATKSAVDRLTRVAAFEAGKLGFGVRVNCVYPGLVPTAMGQQLAVDMARLGLFESPEAAVGAVVEQTPLGRLGEVADMADAVVFLASDQARFITGIGLPVDGGMGM